MKSLRLNGPASIEVWISSPVRSRKPVLMKATAVARGADAFLEVDAGAAFLVHDAKLHRMARQAQHILDPVEGFAAKATSSGPCILGLTT
jgi:hypothetical protein